MSWELDVRELGAGVVLLRFSDDHGRVTWSSMLGAWRTPAGAASFAAALLEAGFEVFRWECPPLDERNQGDPFECVVVEDPSLDVPADSVPFSDHLATTSTTATFASLGGTSTLVAPTKTSGGRTNTAHLGAFLRTAPAAHIADLWVAVADAVEDQLASGPGEPFWLSTAGGGVAWLHVRLDPTPKYYHHDPYR